MTARKSTSRSRRRTGNAAKIPKTVAQWFAGERRFSFVAMGWPEHYALREYWAAWLEQNPGAIPPTNLVRYLEKKYVGFSADLRHQALQHLGIIPAD